MGVRKATVYSTLNQVFLKIIGLVTVILIARLLTPDELGVYAIAATIAFIASEFRNLGTASYLVREKVVDKSLIRACLGLCILISWFMGAGLVLFSAEIAQYFNYQELDLLMVLFSVGFFLAPFTVVPYAMLTREMDFRTIAIVSVSVQTISFVITIYLILNNHSVFSMAYGLVISEVFRIVLMVILAKRYFYWLPSFSNLAPIIRSGLSVSLANMFKKLSMMSSDLVIGKLGSASQVANFSRGVGLLDFVSSITSLGIYQVAFSYISSVKHKQRDITEAYIRASNILLTLSWPVMVCSAVASVPVIRAFFGDQWDDATPLLPGLACWFVLVLANTLSYAVFIASKHEHVRLIKEFIALVVTAVVIAFSYQYGLLATSWSLAVVGAIDFVLSLVLLRKYCGISSWKFIKSLDKNLMLTMGCGVITYIISLFVDFNQENPFIPVLYLAVIMPIVWFLGIKWLKLELYQEIKPFLTKVLERTSLKQNN